MSGEGAYVPQRGDTVKFESPPAEGGGRRFFRVAGRDARTGMISLDGLSRALSADEIAERGGRKMPVAHGDLKPDWGRAGRWLAERGAGHRPKIHQLSPAAGGLRILQADEQAALALAQRAADQAGEPFLLARTANGELVIGTAEDLQAVAEALGAQPLLAVRPGLDGSGGGISVRQARELLGGGQALEAAAAALASAPGLPDAARASAAQAVLEAIAGLLPREEEPRLTTPGWQYREELLPEQVAEMAARASGEPGR